MKKWNQISIQCLLRHVLVMSSIPKQFISDIMVQTIISCFYKGKIKTIFLRTTPSLFLAYAVINSTSSQ